MDISLALRKVRFEKGMKQVDVAKRAKISPPFLSQIESGKKHPPKKVIDRLCKVYGIPYIILAWYGTQDVDIQKGKLEAFKVLKQPMDNLVSELISKK